MWKVLLFLPLFLSADEIIVTPLKNSFYPDDKNHYQINFIDKGGNIYHGIAQADIKMARVLTNIDTVCYKNSNFCEKIDFIAVKKGYQIAGISGDGFPGRSGYEKGKPGVFIQMGIEGLLIKRNNQ